MADAKYKIDHAEFDRLFVEVMAEANVHWFDVDVAEAVVAGLGLKLTDDDREELNEEGTAFLNSKGIVPFTVYSNNINPVKAGGAAADLTGELTQSAERQLMSSPNTVVVFPAGDRLWAMHNMIEYHCSGRVVSERRHDGLEAYCDPLDEVLTAARAASRNNDKKK